MPVEIIREGNLSSPQQHMKKLEMSTQSNIDYIIQIVVHLQDFMDAFTERCKNKTVDILAFLWSTSVKTAQHMDDLIRNLSGFNLKVDKIERDRNFFFRAVASQLNRHLREYREHIEEHYISLGVGISEAFNTRRLRELFVREVSDNIEEYRD